VATFCLIHGNWHDASCWEPLAALLQARGHDVVAPDLPFDQPNATYEQRALPAVEAVASTSGPVVIVGHSAGSAEAGLVAAEGGADLLIYLCPRLGEFGAPAGAPSVFRSGFPFPPRREDGTMVWEPEAAIDAMYPRLDPTTAQTLAQRLRPSASPAGPYPLAAPPDIPKALVYTTDDEFFTPEWERFAARELLGVEAVELPGGHFPMIENPEALAEVFDRLVDDASSRRGT
jgi:pimeloyl-ACP methyl ester carboxylesterase